MPKTQKKVAKVTKKEQYCSRKEHSEMRGIKQKRRLRTGLFAAIAQKLLILIILYYPKKALRKHLKKLN